MFNPQELQSISEAYVTMVIDEGNGRILSRLKKLYSK